MIEEEELPSPERTTEWREGMSLLGISMYGMSSVVEDYEDQGAQLNRTLWRQGRMLEQSSGISVQGQERNERFAKYRWMILNLYTYYPISKSLRRETEYFLPGF